MNKKKNTVLQYLLIAVMGILLAFNYRLFIVPNDFAPAGINGIAVMIQYKLGFSIGYMSLLINVPLCVIAFFTVNRKFAVRTLVFCLVYSLVYLILQRIDGLRSYQYDANGVDTVYPVIIAGLVSGVIYGVLVRNGACSGGTDVISRFVLKRRPEMNFFWITFSLNAVVAASSYFVYAVNVDGTLVHDYKPVCLCMLYCFISSFVGNHILKGTREAVEFIVVTDHPDILEEKIIRELHHTATRLQGKGIYSGKEKTVLICTVNKAQIAEFETLAGTVPDTFVTEHIVSRTVGNFKHVHQKMSEK